MGVIREHLNLPIPFSDTDGAATEKYLNDILAHKEVRSSVEYKEAVRSYRARNAGYVTGVSPLTSGSFMSGGSAAAVTALAQAAERLDLTEGDSEADGADADGGVDEGGVEMEEGPI